MDQTSALIQFDFIEFLNKVDFQFSYAIDRGNLFKDSDGFQFLINYNFTDLSYSQWYNKYLRFTVCNESKHKP